MISCYFDEKNNDYNVNCKEVSLGDLENLIWSKKTFEVQVKDSLDNFNLWKKDMYEKKRVGFSANRCCLPSSTIYLNDDGKISKIWVYNLQDKLLDY